MKRFEFGLDLEEMTKELRNKIKKNIVLTTLTPLGEIILDFEEDITDDLLIQEIENIARKYFPNLKLRGKRITK